MDDHLDDIESKGDGTAMMSTDKGGQTSIVMAFVTKRDANRLEFADKVIYKRLSNIKTTATVKYRGYVTLVKQN